MKPEAWRLAAALFVAGVLSVVVYYGQFGEAFRSAARVPAAAATAAPGSPASAQVSVATRAVDAAQLTVRSVGWPLVLLAIPGVVVWWRRGWRDRLGLAVMALALTYLIFTAGVVVTPVQQAFYRYALEFVTRVTLATYPAMVIWAAVGAMWAWRQQGAARISAIVLVAATILGSGDAWLGWLR